MLTDCADPHAASVNSAIRASVQGICFGKILFIISQINHLPFYPQLRVLDASIGLQRGLRRFLPERSKEYLESPVQYNIGTILAVFRKKRQEA